jgi:hypothetical protein
MPVSADMQDHPLITITSERLIGSCFEILPVQEYGLR